jgi:putative endonuclease
MYFINVLKSLNFDYQYVGFTKDLEKRLRDHNLGKTKSNKAYKPFEIIYFEEVETRIIARKREKYLKSAAGSVYLKKKLAP